MKRKNFSAMPRRADTALFCVSRGSPVASDGGTRNYVVMASVSFLLLAGSCLLAIVGRNRSLAWVAGIFLAADVVAALILVNPQG